MASKNIHHSEISPEIIEDLGFTDLQQIGLMMNNLDVETLYASESESQYNKIINDIKESKVDYWYVLFIIPILIVVSAIAIRRSRLSANNK